MKQPTMSQLIERAWEALDQQKVALEVTGELPLVFVVYGPEKAETIVAGGGLGLMPDDPRVTEAMVETVRERVQAIQGYAVFSFSDTWLTKILGSNHKEIAAIVQQIGSKEAERRGLVKRREALVCAVNTPLHVASCIQYYHRDGTKIVWEEREHFAPEHAGYTTGRMSDYFRDLPMGHA